MKFKKPLTLAGIGVLTFGVGALTTSAFAFQTLKTAGVFTVNNPFDYSRVATIQMQGPKGHGDACTFDPQNSRVFCSMHDHGVDVISTKKAKSIKFLANINQPADEKYYDGYVYVAQGPGTGPGNVNALVVVGADTLKIVDVVKTKGTSDDEITINPITKRLYLGCDDNNWVEVFDVSHPAKPHEVALFHMNPPGAASGVDDGVVAPSLNKLFWSDDWYVGVYNATTGKPESLIDTQVPLAKFGGTKGEQFDPANDTVWVGTTHAGDSGMFVINAKTDQIEKVLPETGGVDGTKVDPNLDGHRIEYAFMRWHGAHGFDAYDQTKMERIAHINVPSGQTHSGTVDTHTHVVYAFGGDRAILFGFKPEAVH